MNETPKPWLSIINDGEWLYVTALTPEGRAYINQYVGYPDHPDVAPGNAATIDAKYWQVIEPGLQAGQTPYRYERSTANQPLTTEAALDMVRRGWTSVEPSLR